MLIGWSPGSGPPWVQPKLLFNPTLGTSRLVWNMVSNWRNMLFKHVQTVFPHNAWCIPWIPISPTFFTDFLLLRSKFDQLPERQPVSQAKHLQQRHSTEDEAHRGSCVSWDAHLGSCQPFLGGFSINNGWKAGTSQQNGWENMGQASINIYKWVDVYNMGQPSCFTMTHQRQALGMGQNQRCYMFFFWENHQTCEDWADLTIHNHPQ